MTTVEAPQFTAISNGQASGAFTVPLELIRPNRYQKRIITDESVASLAENILKHGLKSAPIGRWHSDPNTGVVELAAGHRRWAAFKLLARTDPAFSVMPVQVEPLTDRELYETCVIENEQRAPLSAIERAITLRDYMAEFNVGQAEAGKLFGIGQAAVSHLKSLLELPADIQDLVHRGELPERAARALLPIARWNPTGALTIAAKAVKAGPDDRAEKVDGAIYGLLRDKAISLQDYNRPWPINWPEKPLAIADNRKDKGEPSEIPACRGCPFAFGKGGEMFCLRAPCFAAKSRLYDQTQLAEAAAKLGIPVAAPGEKVTVVWAGGYDHVLRGRAEKLVKSKLGSLRLAINPELHGSYQCAEVLGTDRAILVTTDADAAKRFAGADKSNGAKANTAIVKTANETPQQKERRINATKELEEERKLERAAFNRSKADVLWIVEHTAQLIAERTVAGGGLLAFAVRQTERHYGVSNDDFKGILDGLAEGGKFEAGHFVSDETYSELVASSAPEIDALRRQYLACRVLSHEVAGWQNASVVFADLPGAHEKCLRFARALGVKLPDGWDQPPIHHTPLNCWTCGRFSAAGGGKLTQGDLKEGWLPLIIKPGDVLAGVYCPEHAAKYKGKPLVEALADEAPASTVKAPKPKTPNARAAASAAARAQVLRTAKAGHVRRHTQPAPKPGAAKKTRRKTAKKGK